MTTPEVSGLQVAIPVPTNEFQSPKYVVRNSWEKLPETLGDDKGKYSASSAEREEREGGGKISSSSEASVELKKEKKLCGLSRRTFYILLGLVILLVIAAAIGGGVGGSKAAKTGKNTQVGAAKTSSTQATSAVQTSSSTSTATSSALASASSSSTPNFSFTIYQEESFHGTMQNISRPGSYNLNFAGISYIWVPDKTGCCIRFCQNETSVGWRCDLETYQNKSSSAIDRTIIVCNAGSPPDQSLCGTGETSQGG